MDEDIFKDMIDYGDNTPENEETASAEETVQEPETEEVVLEEPSQEPETETDSFMEYTEDMDDPEEYEYIPYNDETDDESLIIPVIKPVLKWLIPLVAVICVVVFVMKSDIAVIKNYRENFIANTGQLMSNMGIDLTKEKVQEGSDKNENAIEYKEASQSEQEDEAVQYRTAVLSDVKLTFDGASAARFIPYNEGVICAKTNYLCYINKNGTVEWEKNVSVIDPILKGEGEYFIIAQKNGTKFAMYRGSEEIYENTSDNNILSVNVSANGDAVLVTQKPGYKGAIAVYNKRGDKAFAWSSGTSSIISADICAKSRRVAAALLNTDDTVKSGVYLFNIKKPDSYAQQIFEDSLVYNVDFKDNYLNVFSDTAMTGMKKNGKVMYRIEYGAAEPVLSDVDDNGDKLVLFTGTNIPMMNVYNKRGNLKNTVSARKTPDFAHVFDGNIIYNVDREVFLSKLNTRIPYKYTAAMDIQRLIPIDEKSFVVVYSNSLSVVRMKGVIW